MPRPAFITTPSLALMVADVSTALREATGSPTWLAVSSIDHHTDFCLRWVQDSGVYCGCRVGIGLDVEQPAEAVVVDG
jgi:hypothetical protein